MNRKQVAAPKLGIYKHYKGMSYQVLALCSHSETLEPMVLYRALYGERGLWVRPAAMFAETVEINGERIARFAFIEHAEPTW